MNIKNPTEVDVTINFKGENFTVAAGKTEAFPSEVVKHWVSIHSFMLISEDNEKQKENVKDEAKKEVKKEEKKVTKK